MLFCHIKSIDYKQSAYIHLPLAGKIRVPTARNPEAFIHDNVPFA